MACSGRDTQLVVGTAVSVVSNIIDCRPAKWPHK